MEKWPSPADAAPQGGIFGRERRRAHRHRIYRPLYASLSGSAPGAMDDLSEIHNISETGLCVQFAAQTKVNRLLPLCLELSPPGTRIYAVGHVVWSEPSGKTGVRVPSISESSRARLQEWLEANSKAELTFKSGSTPALELDSQDSATAKPEPSSDPSSAVQTWDKIERDIESCGRELERALHLIAQHAVALSSASGAGIALNSKSDPAAMICRARAGTEAPEIGTRLQAGSGFSAECVRLSAAIVCRDTENDLRVDRASCRALGVRSMAAAPIKRNNDTIGIVETFSPTPGVFQDADIATLNKLAALVTQAVQRSEFAHAETSASTDAEQIDAGTTDESRGLEAPALLSPPSSSPGRRIAWFSAATACFIAVAWMLAPTIVRDLSSSQKPDGTTSTYAAGPETFALLTFSDLEKRANAGEPGAEYALAMRYANGIDVEQDYREAKDWFLRAAEQGDTQAQGKVAAAFWEGKGGTQDYSKAYFWAVLAQAGGDEVSRQIVMSCAARLSPVQIAAEQKEADQWLHSHRAGQAEN